MLRAARLRRRRARNVVVYLHGWNNCIENIVRAEGGPCTPGSPARSGFGLIDQMEAAGRNALLLLLELPSFNVASSSAGRLDEPGLFRALLGEALGALRSVLGERGVADVAHLVVASHSGGYNAAASLVACGQVPVAKVPLLDSLYGRQEDFAAWMEEDRGAIGSAPWDGRRRFLSVYTARGGTLRNNNVLADQIAGWGLPAAALLDDHGPSAWDVAHYRHGIPFKFSTLTHDGTARYYFLHFLSTSAIPPSGRPSS